MPRARVPYAAPERDAPRKPRRSHAPRELGPFEWTGKATPKIANLRARYDLSGITAWDTRAVCRIAKQLRLTFEELAELCGDQDARLFTRCVKKQAWPGYLGLHFDRIKRFLDAHKFNSVVARMPSPAEIAEADFLAPKPPPKPAHVPRIPESPPSKWHY